VDPKTGQIKEFMSQKEAEQEGYTIPLTRSPKSSCKKCHGRGYIGMNDEGNKVPCSCSCSCSD